MKVKELKLLLDQVDDELEIVYHSLDERIIEGVEGISVSIDRRRWKKNNKDIVYIEQYIN